MARFPSQHKRKDADSRRQQILDAAVLAFGQYGYHGFTVHALAQRCQLSNAGLLHYFASKDRLLAAVLQELELREQRAQEPFIARIKREVARKELSLPTLLRFMHAMLARQSSNAEFARLYTMLQTESLERVHPAHELFCRRECAELDHFARLVAPFVAQPRSTARHMVALLDGLRMQWLRSDHKFDLVEEWGRAVTNLVPELTAPRAPVRRKPPPTKPRR